MVNKIVNYGDKNSHCCWTVYIVLAQQTIRVLKGKGTDHVMLCCRVFLVITTGVLFRIVQPCGKDLTHVSVALIIMCLENLQLVGTPLLAVTSLYLDALSVWYILSSCIDMWQQYQNESCVAIMTVLCITICS